MSAYIHGNLAVDEKKTLKQPEKKVRETTKTVVRKKSIPMQEKLLYLFTIVVCVVVAGFIIFRYAQIYEMNVQMQKINKEIELLKQENIKLETKIAQLQNPQIIEEKAKELGFLPYEKGIQEIKKSVAAIPTQQEPTAMLDAPR
jgi:cell division protein FtsL